MDRNEHELPDAWWAEPADAIAERLGVDPAQGLSAGDVGAMRARYGANSMVHEGPASTWELLRESITSPMMLLLLAIAAISLLLRQVREAVVMAFVVLTYVGVELINKARTDRTMARLRALQAPEATVLREGRLMEVPAADVVVGDILPLQPGSRVPADARLLSTAGLLVDEAPLTGESSPQAKDAGAPVIARAPLAERPTAVYAGTTVLDGQGRALVVAVGASTELGRVAELSARADPGTTPLQEEMNKLARVLAFVAIGVSLVIPLVGLLRGFDLQQMLLTWLALTFLMVPGQPPIIIAMALALASFELARKNVIVRRLRGAETLGSVDTLLSDKTGTITQNTMRLTAIVLGDGTVLERDGIDAQERRAWERFLWRALPAIPATSKDPTDRAIWAAAEELGIDPPHVGELVNEIGFARGGTRRTLVYDVDGAIAHYVAGSPGALIDDAARWEGDGSAVALAAPQRETLSATVDALASQGRRVTAYAYRDAAAGAADDALVLVGLATLEDPVRPEVRDAIDALRGAGVRTIMVTGDNAVTARYVAEQVGLDTTETLSGPEIDGPSLGEALARTQVFARATPEQKLRLVEAARDAGRTVAGTGDGVNDAPALRSAHIGIAMGETGTDVARETAGLILTDDNLAHLPDAVAIGRKAYDNFSKGITYYLSAKAILLSIFIVPLAIGVPFPLAPIQIIATELLMDLASSTIFVTEEAEPDVLQRPPRRRRRYLSRAVGLRILRNTVGLALAILAVYLGSLWMGVEVATARTAAWATWLLGHIVLALNLKQEHVPLLEQGILSNRFGAAWLLGMIALVLAMTHIPGVMAVLSTTPLRSAQWAMVIAGAVFASGWIELCKWARRQREHTAKPARGV
jgi:Ca2+-transporting ATPase